MAILFPVGLDNFTNPTAANNLNTPAVLHSDQHANANDAIEALEAKVGIDGSLDVLSLDYKVAQLEASSHAPVTLGTANGLSLAGQVLSLGLASSGVTGALSGADWDTFNGKQAALTFPLSSTLGGTGVNNAGTLTNASNTTITGGGTVALGGFTLTVPATGTAALLATANVFTTQQMVDGTSDQIQSRIQAHSSQTENIETIEKSDGTVIAGFDSLGRIFSYGGSGITSNFFAQGAGNATLTSTTNVAIGFESGQSLTSGVGGNVLLGQRAGWRITSGVNNSALGTSALSSLLTNTNCVAIGGSALAACTASSIIGIGFQAGLAATTGVAHVFIGTDAGSKIVAASGVTAIGNSALKNATGGSSTVIGALAGLSNTSGATNIFIGANAGYNQTTLSNLLIIDATPVFSQRASAAVEAQNSFLYGSMAAGGFLQLNIPTTTNNAVKDTFKLQAYVSTASTGAANGFGVGLPFYAETATDATYQQQGLISTSWIDATNVSRKAKMSLSAYDTAARLGFEIEASGTVVKLGFFGVAPVVRPTALTTQLTTITHTAPTPDYAIQDLVDSSGGAAFGFATKDEGNTVLSVIANLQTRVGELETKLQALGLLT